MRFLARTGGRYLVVLRKGPGGIYTGDWAGRAPGAECEAGQGGTCREGRKRRRQGCLWPPWPSWEGLWLKKPG